MGPHIWTGDRGKSWPEPQQMWQVLVASKIMLDEGLIVLVFDQTRLGDLLALKMPNTVKSCILYTYLVRYIYTYLYRHIVDADDWRCFTVFNKHGNIRDVKHSHWGSGIMYYIIYSNGFFSRKESTRHSGSWLFREWVFEPYFGGLSTLFHII